MFTIYAKFIDWKGFVEEKTEHCDNWDQIFGAFIIYSSDPDCEKCYVSIKNSHSNMQKVLQYDSPYIAK